MNPETTSHKEPLASFALLTCRLIQPTEQEVIREAVAIDNALWGAGLPSTLEEFVERTRNGYLIGAFSRDGALQGTISCLRARARDIEAIGGPEQDDTWTTWLGATAHGRLSTAVEDGDCLLCVAVTSRLSTTPQELSCRNPLDGAEELVRILNNRTYATDPRDRKLIDSLTSKVLDLYLEQRLDHVIRFHQKPKCGVLGGAEIWKVIPHGRIDDTDSLGYNIVLRYPELRGDSSPIDCSSIEVSVGETLVFAAFLLARSLSGLRYVAPYSRPAGLRRALLTVLDAQYLPTKPAWAAFAERVTQVTQDKIERV